MQKHSGGSGAEECWVDGSDFSCKEGMHAEQQPLQRHTLQLLQTTHQRQPLVLATIALYSTAVVTEKLPSVVFT